jgi:hypothetical protein
MTNSKQNPENGASQRDNAVREFVSRLSMEHKMLVVLKRQLYAGNWDDMLEDLNNRLDGKPYVFKLVNRINDDMERINELCEFEAQHNIDLGDYVEL